MPGVFVSHASQDEALVGRFVDTVLRLGCGLGPEDLFYSSRGDTGVPSGSDLNSYVRRGVANAGLVVAILTPRFQSRPFCVAELGAAWSRAEQLFPLALPSMRRDTLDGVLSGMLIRTIDDPTALDELHDAVAKTTSKPSSALTWGKYKQQWLAEVDAYIDAAEAGVVRRPTSVAACSREPGHMEVFWADGSGRVFYRWWLGSTGWAQADHWDEPPATHVAAVSRRHGDEWLFGVNGQGQVWTRRWHHRDPPGYVCAGEPDWIAGDVCGPLTALSQNEAHLELVAWTPAGEQCHIWRERGEWTDWTTEWWAS